MLSTRIARAPRLLKPTTLNKHAHLPPPRRPPPLLRRPFSSHRGEQYNKSQPRFALIPFFLSSPLLLDSSDTSEKPSLATIKEAIDHPDEDEFLIAEGAGGNVEHPSLFRRTLRVIRIWVWEPLSTTARFIHLAVLFLPVILTSPIMFLEYIDSGRDKRRGYKKHEGERATTRWWYRLLVNQMERAGPTFIKVSPYDTSDYLRVAEFASAARSMGWISNRPVPRRALRPLRQATLERQASLPPLHQESDLSRFWQAFRRDLPRIRRETDGNWRDRSSLQGNPQSRHPSLRLPRSEAHD